ncbi:unnamed protein product [Microthlaspi erraticum]|uniref:Uncharacterized protein n=1 Tax=Microthlaspi erraticum TaxID=1685480 RepID=A0A6D2HC19_9BRAS|nr:unnamed protein product [Microthlaspi erraticum]
MEAERDEGNNPSPFWNIARIGGTGVVLALGFLSFPAIISSVQPVIDWLNWFIYVVACIFGFVSISTFVAWIYFANHKPTEKEKKRDLYDDYFPAAPTVVHRPAMGYYDVAEARDYNNGGGSYNKEVVEAFEQVETYKAVKESNCYGRVEVEEVNSRSYRRTRSSVEKKMEKKARVVEYRRAESERAARTGSRRSQQPKIDELSSEDFRATVESFIMEKKMFLQWQNGAADPAQNGAPQLQNGVAGHWQNGAPQLQNGDYWQNGVPQLQNGDYWQNGVPQLQNGDYWQNGVPQLENGVDQWQNGVGQWQGQPYDDGRHHHGNRRLVGGSGPNGSGPYLAISN